MPKFWHSNDKYRHAVWQYTDKFKGVKCTTSNLDEDRIKETYPKALAIILSNKDELIAMLIPNVIVIIDKYINHKKQILKLHHL